MQHMARIRLGCVDPGARPGSVTADGVMGVFAFGNVPPRYRCAHSRENFRKSGYPAPANKRTKLGHNPPSVAGWSTMVEKIDAPHKLRYRGVAAPAKR